MRINIYISEGEKELVNFLRTQDNYSKYIRRLIEQDMSNNHPLTEKEIISLIQKHCQNSKEVLNKTTIDDLFG